MLTCFTLLSVAQIPTKNEKLIAWVKEWEARMQPKNVYWCDGSKEEYQFMCDMLVQAGSFVKLNPKKRPDR